MWTKNGKTSGNGKDDILNIEIKVKSRVKGNVDYRIYQNGKWTQTALNSENKKFKNKKINGIKISLTDLMYKKYIVYYRTYNKEDKWMEWSNDSNISGNKDQPIKKIEIKILLKESSLEDYLKDYSENEAYSKGFGEVGE